MTEVGAPFYRYEGVRWAAPLNEFDEPEGVGRRSVELRTYRVVRVTPCGVRLDNGKFVNRERVKQFAHATKEAALEAFMARAERHATILSSRLADVMLFVSIAKSINEH